MARLAVGILDDHDVVRSGVRAMAERDPGLTFWGSAEDASGLAELVAKLGAPDVLLLDLRLRDDDGIDVCRKLLADHPRTRVLIFTAYGDFELFSAAVRVGAAGYVLKDTSMDHLPAIVQSVAEGTSTYCDPRLTNVLIEKAVQNEAPAQASLTAREAEVLRLVAEGKTNREIAEVLCISPHTAKFHVSKLMRRFDATRRSHLISAAYEGGLL